MDDSRVWSDLIQAVGPASLLVLIKRRMSAALLARLAPEDVGQEALLHAWRDRGKAPWHGVAAFRRRLITIIDHRLHDLADEAAAQKRGAGSHHVPAHAIQAADASSTVPVYAGPVATTTPSRAAADRETAAAMDCALEAVAEDVREIVRLRLFEDLSFDELGERLGIGGSTAARRFRLGIDAYYRALSDSLGFDATGPHR